MIVGNDRENDRIDVVANQFVDDSVFAFLRLIGVEHQGVVPHFLRFKRHQPRQAAKERVGHIRVDDADGSAAFCPQVARRGIDHIAELGSGLPNAAQRFRMNLVRL